MTFTRATYDTAAPALIAELDSIQDRFSIEHAAAMEALSILSSVRDAAAFGAPLVVAGEHRFVISTGISIGVVDTLEQARAYIAEHADHRFPRGRAIVEVDYTGAEELFTDHALEAPRLEPVGPALKVDEVFEADAAIPEVVAITAEAVERRDLFGACMTAHTWATLTDGGELDAEALALVLKRRGVIAHDAGAIDVEHADGWTYHVSAAATGEPLALVHVHAGAGA